jgi:guanyl-specific ribonuclease Sa
LYHQQLSDHRHSFLLSLRVRRAVDMRFSATLSAIAAVAVSAASAAEPLSQQTDHVVSLNTQEIEAIEANKTYVVKLECVGCPFPVQDYNGNVVWQQSQDNALVRKHTRVRLTAH